MSWRPTAAELLESFQGAADSAAPWAFALLAWLQILLLGLVAALLEVVRTGLAVTSHLQSALSDVLVEWMPAPAADAFATALVAASLAGGTRWVLSAQSADTRAAQAVRVDVGFEPPPVSADKRARLRGLGWSPLSRDGHEWGGAIAVGARTVRAKLLWDVGGSWRRHFLRPPGVLTQGRGSICWHSTLQPGWQWVNLHDEELRDPADVELALAATREWCASKLDEAVDLKPLTNEETSQ